MAVQHLVVVGASAGGVEALRSFVAGLPQDLKAPVLVVLHLPASGPSVLPSILERAGRLPAKVAEDGEGLRNGQVYIGAADRHLTVAGSTIRLTNSPKENGVRPAVDVLFRSAAEAYGPTVAGVVLSGALDDGAAGLLTIRESGGLGLVQSPEEALYPSMPESAISVAGADETAPVATLGGIIERWLTTDQRGSAPPRPAQKSAEAKPSPFSCPDCGGVLWQHDDDLLHFRCRVGHAWASEALLEAQSAVLEDALWAALRVMEERSELALRLAQQARADGRSLSAQRYEHRASNTVEHALVLRGLVEELQPWAARKPERSGS